MTKAQLLKRVEHWRQRLAPEWLVAVCFDGEIEDGHAAEVTSNQRRRQALINLRTDYLGHVDEEEINIVIVHELLHPLLNTMRDQEEPLLEAYVPSTAAEVFKDQRELAEESFIDRMAQVIVTGDMRQFTVESHSE